MPAVITFAHPAMLAGLVLVVLPVLIHLVHRGRPRVLVFPTVRFLREATTSQPRIRRWRHVVLMILRCGFVACLAVAFARPQWFRSAGAAADVDRETLAVLVLDVSASMGYADSPVAMMDQAVARAGAILDGLEPARGDRASVIRAGVAARALSFSPTSDFTRLRRQVESLRATAERTDAGGSLAVAASQLQSGGALRKELHIISDFQRTSWADADLAGLPADVRVILHRIAPRGDRPNAGIADIRVHPPQPILGGRCRVGVHVVNRSPAAERRDVVLRASDGREWRQRGVLLPAIESVVVSFDVSFEQPGVWELTAEITPDHLAIDDRRYAVVHVVSRMPIVLCTDANLDEGVTSGYLLARALSPFAEGQGGIDLRVARGGDLGPPVLAGAEVVVLDASGALSSAGLGALREFIQGGGGVVVFLGPGAAAENLIALGGGGGDASLLPFVPGAMRGAAGGASVEGLPSSDSSLRRRGVSVEVTDPGHPLLRSLAAGDGRLLGDVRIYRHYATSPGRTGVPPAAALSSGDAAIGVASIGAGTLVVCNISPDPDWSDVARHAVFPGLVHQFVEFSRPRQRTVPEPCAGEPAVVRWRTDGQLSAVEIRDPGGERVHATVRREGPTAVVELPGGAGPGYCRIYSDGRLVESVAVNVDPRESDLAAVNLDAVGSAGPRATSVVDAGTVDRRGRPLWHWAMTAALCLLACELLCLAYWRS